MAAGRNQLEKRRVKQEIEIQIPVGIRKGPGLGAGKGGGEETQRMPGGGPEAGTEEDPGQGTAKLYN